MLTLISPHKVKAELFHVGLVGRSLPSQDSSVNGGVEGLNTAAEHLGETGELGHVPEGAGRRRRVWVTQWSQIIYRSQDSPAESLT